ncbi:putative F-box domain, FBD domain, leucine-rich repeat domain, L domain-containing protein [Medicago truncatula]|uniref:Putative F-box domain, FBD domain, leucine-rich repeat domain, L domain-containing protein n=1 Tax=Medicago truncatula TaxID=3880 RepID=A0A396GVP7_MEDTR|nr:FBD-associated F-box protein At5g56370 [Medicago truncatula]RHN45189.1 putative F-box domain, FBD domain, leucine-rich repeat domain, L domain-containing protein [Medicago truncatula]
MSSPRSISTVDRISALPDSVICHILSFLPTKQSAATSILSKRWNPLWHSVFTLDFDDHGFADFATFRYFVFCVMLARDPTLPLRSFRLKCGASQGCDPQDINRFVRAAVQRGTQNFIMETDLVKTDREFLTELGSTVSTIFNSRNLVVLKLKTLLVTDLPQINFPLLKTLHLKKVYILRDFNKLIEGCPILEELEITTSFLFRFSKDGIGEFKHSNLVRVNISKFGPQNFPFAWICNAKILRLELQRSEDQVHAFHNLTHMELIFTSNWRTKWKWLLEMLKNCPKLQNLTLHKLYGHGIDEDDWKEPEIIPNCLSSQLRTCSLIDYKGMKCELQFAEYVLKNANLLRTMTISASPGDLTLKHQMLMDLSLCPRGSIACKLSFI